MGSYTLTVSRTEAEASAAKPIVTVPTANVNGSRRAGLGERVSSETATDFVGMCIRFVSWAKKFCQSAQFVPQFE